MNTKTAAVLHRLEQALFVILAIALCAYKLHEFWNFYWDDSFVTFRYGVNLATGYGFRYNVDVTNPLVSSSPLFCMILGAIGFFLQWFDTHLVHRAAIIVSAICIAGNGILVYWHARRLTANPLLAYAAGLAICALNSWWCFISLETNLFLFCALLAIHFFCYRRYHIAAVVAFIAYLARGDGALVVAVLAAAYAVATYGMPARQWRAWFPWVVQLLKDRSFIVYISTVLALLAVWSMYSWYTFGSPFPATMKNKIIQGHLRLFGPNFMDNTFTASFPPLFQMKPLANLAVFGAYLAAFAGMLWRVKKDDWKAAANNFFVLAAVFGFVQCIAYTLIGVAEYPWYRAPIILSFVCTLFYWATQLCAGGLLRPFNWRLVLKTAMAVAAFAVVLHFNYQTGARYSPHSLDGALYKAYREIGDYLTREAKAGDMVVVGEVGEIGYYTPSNVIVYDFYGVTFPDVFKDGRDIPAAIAKLAKDRQPRFLMKHWYTDDTYAVARVFKTEYMNWEMTMLEKKKP